jgi:TonB family protein
MDAFTSGLATYSVQILLLVASSVCASTMIRVRAPHVRLIYWQFVLVVCLLLPLAPPHVIDVDVATGTQVIAAVTGAREHLAGAHRVPAATAAVWVLMGGILAKALWLFVGLFRLRLLRTAGTIAALSGDLALLQRTVAPAAEVRWHDRIVQPVTFGLARPVVLLPSRLRQLSPDVQRAVLCHELLHASRRDWRSILIEEIVRTAFWFHPAIWWLIARIQLCREETVDALAVSITASRRLYMQALLAFADSTPQPLMAAPLFARRRHLVVRIRQLSQEVVMSPRRIVFSAAALLAIVTACGWTVVSALPVRTELRARSVSEKQEPGARSPLLGRALGPDVSRAATDIALPVARAILEPAAQRIVPSTQTTVRPAPPPLPPPPPPPPADGKSNPRVVAEVKPAYPPEALPYGTGATVWVVVTIDATGQVAAAKANRFQLTIDRSIDDPNYWASKPERPFMDAAEAAALQWKFAPPDANTRISVEVLFTFRNVPGPALVAGQLDTVATVGHKILRVGTGISAPRKIVDVRPVYPEAAKAQDVQGVVILELRIDLDGSVKDATVVRSIPLLDDAALAAARQWKFQPTLLNGAPVEMIMTTTVNFLR